MLAAGSPEFISSLLGDALRSGTADDRLLTLAAANYHDDLHQTTYGKAVVRKFMRRSGLRFMDLERFDQAEGYQISSVSAGVGRIYREVSKALGPITGATVLTAELLSASSNRVVITSNIPGSDTTMSEAKHLTTFPDGEIGILDISQEKPYLIGCRGTYRQLYNFNTASRAMGAVVLGSLEPAKL